jgi:hypothetical protein
MSRRALGLVAALGAALVLAGPAPAADAAACSGSSGVTVVVDYGSLGGIQVGCAAGDPGTGLSALHSAGFATTGTVHDGPGFVCRINGAPASDPCVRTPPTTAYWSYWHGNQGAWSYSGSGAALSNPQPGGVEGWSYGAGARPGIAPPKAAPPAPTTKAAPKPPAPPKPAPPRTSAPGAPGVPGGPGEAGAPGTSGAAGSAGAPGRSGAPSARPSAGAGASTAAPSTSAGRSGTPDPAGSTAVAGAEATAEPGPPAGSRPAETGGSSLLPVLGSVLGGVLVIGLGVAGFVVARRRRGAV